MEPYIAKNCKTYNFTAQLLSLYNNTTMLSPQSALFPIEILLQTIINQFLSSSYCLTVISEKQWNFSFNKTFIYLIPNEDLENQILDVSQKGCSDYIVRIKEPQKFMIAFDKVNHIGDARRSDRKIIFLPDFEGHLSNDTEMFLDLLSMREVGYVTNVILIVPSEIQSECESFDIVTHKYVGADDEINLPLYMDKWNSCTQKFSKNAYLFPHESMTNVYGKTMYLACFTYKPYVLLDLDSSVVPIGRDGIDIRIVEEFCRWINCSIKLVRDDAHQWGEYFDNGTGNGVLGNVFAGRADIGAAGLGAWYDEYSYFDFSAAYLKSAVTCIAPSPRLLASWKLPILPFRWSMWLAIFFTFFYASLALTLAQRCSAENVFLGTFGMMITQSQNDAGASWRIRSVTGWLLITGLVLDNAYGGGLASIFTVPQYEPSVDTIQDMVDRKLPWGCTHDAWIFSIASSTDPLIKQLVSLFKVYTPEQLERLSYTRTIAFGLEKLPTGYFAIGEYVTAEATLDLTIMLEDFYYVYVVLMLRKSSPYTEKLSELIGRLHQSGLLLAWETQVVLNHLNFKVQRNVQLSRNSKDVNTVKPLDTDHVVGIFFIYLTGVMLSIMVFLIEVLVHRSSKVNKQLQN